jgi:hypothetical protein
LVRPAQETACTTRGNEVQPVDTPADRRCSWGILLVQRLLVGLFAVLTLTLTVLVVPVYAGA